MSQWDDRGRRGDDWAAPGSMPSSAEDPAVGWGGETGATPAPPPSAAPVGAAPAGALSTRGPGGVPELWPGPIPLRPMSFGEILESAFRVLRFNPKTLFGVSFAVIAVSTIVSMALVMGLFALVMGTADLFTMSDDGSFAGGTSYQLSSLLVSLVSALLGGFLIVPVAESALGRRLTAGETWRRVRGRLLHLLLFLVLSVLVSVLILAPFAVAVVLAFTAESGPAIAAVLLLGLPLTVAALVFVSIRLCLAPAAIVLESLGPVEAIRRSFRLTAGAFWRTLGVTFVMQLIAGVITGTLMTVLMVGVIAAVAMTSGANDTAAGIVIVAATAVTSTLSATVAQPMSAAAVALVYLDRRFRTEALAVDLLAEAERSRVAR